MTRLCLFLLAVLLGGCAARTPPPFDDPACAVSTDEKEPDGGYGGTGKLPENCPPS